MSLSAEARAVRTGKITGTTMAGVLGISPYLTPLQAYQQIIGEREVEPNEPMEWGVRLEPVVAAAFAERNQVAIERCETMPHPTLPFLAASGDYRILDTGELLEIKTASDRQRVAWGEPGTDEIPHHYLLQCGVQMAVYDVRVVRVAVLFAGQEMREYRVERDDELEGYIVDRGAAFYEDHLVPRIPPPASCPAEALEYLKQRYPQDNASTVEASPEIEDVIREYLEAKALVSEAVEIADTAEARIKRFMGEAAELHSCLGKAYWKTSKPRRDTDWRSLALRLGATADLITDFTTIKPGSRSFRSYFSSTQE